jgi:probable rRNA maturation factor
MKHNEINITIEKGMRISITKIWIRNCIDDILSTLDIKESIEISLLITDDRSIHKLNSQYRKKNQPTDVLSFSMNEGQFKNSEETFMTPPDEINHIGEIIISYETAKVQAREYRHTVKTEMFNLILHGILHLLGYDHIKPQDENKMNEQADRVKTKLKMKYSLRGKIF